LRKIDAVMCQKVADQIASERQQSDLFFASIKRMLKR
jgi:hypothetical protein